MLDHDQLRDAELTDEQWCGLISRWSGTGLPKTRAAPAAMSVLTRDTSSSTCRQADGRERPALLGCASSRQRDEVDITAQVVPSPEVEGEEFADPLALLWGDGHRPAIASARSGTTATPDRSPRRDPESPEVLGEYVAKRQSVPTSHRLIRCRDQRIVTGLSLSGTPACRRRRPSICHHRTDRSRPRVPARRTVPAVFCHTPPSRVGSAAIALPWRVVREGPPKGEVIEAQFGEASGRLGSRGLPSTPHRDEDRALAYEVWRTEGAQNATLTAALLQDSHGVTIPYRTLARWVNDEHWPRRAHLDRLRTVSGHVSQDTALNLHEAANHASRYLLQVTSGTIPEPDRWLLKAAEVALDRAGFGPSRPDHAPLLVLNEGREDVTDLDALTDSQLAELASGTINR